MIAKIVTGAQTGADRAALDVALAFGIPTGGWIPRGRLAEDGTVPARYPGLTETASAVYAERTRLNVRDSDATLIVTFGTPTGGTELTARYAAGLGKPLLVADLEQQSQAEAAEAVFRWLADTKPMVLNVAGPRASEEPRITAATATVLRAALRAPAASPTQSGS